MSINNTAMNNPTEDEDHLHELENSLDIELETLKRKKQTRDEIINALHKYNDIKDATQEVLGRIAIVEGVTVAEIHRKYQLLDSD